MRTLVSTLVVGVCLVAAPAFAQQHPWAPSSVYSQTGNADEAAGNRREVERAYGRHEGSARSASHDAERERGQVDKRGCVGTHPVYLCPGE